MASKLSKWVKRISTTQVEEIDCSECLHLVSQFVDLELASKDAAGQLPQVSHHLEQCTVCFEEYRLLRDLARFEQEGKPPSTDDLKNRLRE